MSQRAAVALVSSLCVLVSVSVRAQDNSAHRDPQAVALLSRSAQVLTNGNAVRDITLMGTVRHVAGSNDETGQLTARSLSNGEMRVEYAYPSGTQSESRMLSAHGAVENWSGADGAKHAVVPHNVAPLSPWFSPTVLLQELESSPAVTVEYVGKEKRSSHDVEHITVAAPVLALHHPKVMLELLQKSARVELYLDDTNGLPVAIGYNTHADKNLAQDIPVEVRFSDYRTVDGVQVPYRVQKYLNHARLLDITVSTANLNSGLSASALGLQ